MDYKQEHPMRTNFLKSYIYLLTLLIFTSCVAKSDDFNIEDEGLKPVPKSVDDAIRKSQDVENECKIIGKTIDLATQQKKHDYVATTANACQWGANAGPVWVVKNNKVVLSTSTQSIKLITDKTDNLAVIQTSHGTAGIASVQFWSFIDGKYKVTHTYVFTPDDEATCKSHKDICPFQF